MEAREYLRIPMDRIGVVLGENGKIKKEIETATHTEIEVDSQTGEVTIELVNDAKDPLLLLRAKDIIQAIGRGFNPQRAFKLLDEEYALEVLDLTDFVGESEKALKRYKGRVIGEEGKTRKTIEQLTGASISVYGKTIGMIGTFEQIDVTREALRMLLTGSTHGSVYKFLERKRDELKKKATEIWKPV
ncbi:MAG: KH domain-containing protein [Euryarchaeota archaeon]|nr:KH domain-containing protein [Euryarchaeota archaeon]